MDGVQSIPLSAFVATLLLKKRVVTAIEIVSLINEVSRNCDIYVDDDDFEILSCCVEVSENGNDFKIKDDLNYDSIVFVVSDVLKEKIEIENLGCNFNKTAVSVRGYLKMCSLKLFDYYNIDKGKEDDYRYVRRLRRDGKRVC